MQLVILIIVIPLCSVSFFIYLNTLMNYAFNNVLNIPLFSGGLLGSLILGFIAFHLFGSIRVLSAKRLNYENKLLPNFSYYSFFILLLFGVSLIINSISNEFNMFAFSGGVISVLLFIYVTFFYMFSRKKDVFTLTGIDYIGDDDLDSDDEENINSKEKDEEDKIKVTCLIFENDKVGTIEYYVDENNYELDKHYMLIYNPRLKIIKKILNEVSVID